SVTRNGPRDGVAEPFGALQFILRVRSKPSAGRKTPRSSCVPSVNRGLPLALLLLAAASPVWAGLAPSDAARFPVPRRDALTFWGHACCYLDVDGYGIVTDPVFQKAFTIERRHIPTPPPASYRSARLVLLSHAHPDHLDAATLSTFPADCVILCPEPSKKYLGKVPQQVRTMRPGDSYAFPGGR